MMRIGAIMWEKTVLEGCRHPFGDWPLKTTLIALILGLWLKGRKTQWSQ